MTQPSEQVSKIEVDFDHDFGIEYNHDKEPVLDASVASAIEAQQERLEREKQPVPPKPQKELRVLKSGRLDTLKPSRHWRPRQRQLSRSGSRRQPPPAIPCLSPVPSPKDDSDWPMAS
jgi:hypothetical protein